MKTIQTSQAPKAIGPYSQGVIASSSELIFVSGQLPVDPKSGSLIQGNIGQLTAQVIKNMEAIIIAGGSQLSNVIKVEIFMTDLTQFSEMNTEYSKFFKGPHFPARQTIQVTGLPLGSKIEMSCIAIKN